MKSKFVPSSSFKFLQVPSSSFKFLQVPSSSFKFLQVVISLIFFNFGVSFAQISQNPHECPIEDVGWLYYLSSSTEPTKAFGKLSNNGKGNIISTKKEMQPYIDIDLGKSYKVNKIRLVSPTEARLKTYSIFVSSEKFPEKNKEGVSELPSNNVSADKYITPPTFSSSDSVAFFPPLEGRYFRIQLNGDEPQSLVLSGLEFFGLCGGSSILRDPEESNCSNGGFELGNFDGWRAETGEWGAINGVAVPILTSDGVVARRHTIIPLPLVDEFAPISSPCTGSYIVRLGDIFPGGSVDRLTYTLSLNSSNADFFFRYAFVLQDAPHTPEENPFFKWRIYHIQNNIQVTIQEDKVVNDPLVFNPFFDRIKENVLKGRTFLYKNWECINIDLSAYVGKTLYVEFTVADCHPSEHLAYAYIDGLCSTLNDNKPKGVITGKDVVCSDANFEFSGESSCNTDRYTWSLSELTSSGQEINTVSKDFFNAPKKINIFKFYEDNGHTFDFGKRYRLKLSIGNGCINGQTVFKDIFVPDRKSTSYKNIAVCEGYVGEIKMVNNAPCPTCTVRWSPFYKFENPNEPNAVLRPQFAQCDSKFTVTTTDEVGCVYTNDVNLYTLNPSILTVRKDVDKTDVGQKNPAKSVYCGYAIEADVHSTCLPIRYFKLGLTTEADPNFSATSWYTAFDEANGNYTYKFIIPQRLGDNIQNASGKVTVSFMLTDAGNNFVKVYGSCMPSQVVNLENRYWYFGYWEDGQIGPGNFRKGLLPVNGGTPGIFIPNAINTASPNPDNNEFKAFSANGYGYSAFWYRTEIYNRWGDRVFVKEETAEHPTINLHNRFADKSWIGWDGKMFGEWIIDATVVWYINAENCTTERKTQGNLPRQWSGDVNVVRIRR